MSDKKLITKEQFIHETLVRSRAAHSPVVAARYWELLGKALGYVDADTQINVALFKDISVDALKYLKRNAPILEKPVPIVDEVIDE